jgi:hypothetical protein
LTGTKWRLARCRWFSPKFAELPPAESIRVLAIKKPGWFRAYHCVALEGDWVHDPAFKRPIPQVSYPMRHCRVPIILVPENIRAYVDFRRKRRFANALASD